MLSKRFIVREVKRLLETSSKEDVERIKKLVDQHGSGEDKEIYEGISSICRVNIERVIEYALEIMNNSKKEKKRVVKHVKPKKKGLFRRLIAFLF